MANRIGREILRTRRKLRRALNSLGRQRQCYICRKTFAGFLPHNGGLRSVPPFIRELDIIGSDVENFACPSCHCNDRERHLFMYFDALRLWDELRGAAILHIAPETHVAARLAGNEPGEYVRGDLLPAQAEIQRVDVTALDFPANHFDLVVCSHVLEHVSDDRRAMAELLRVLKPEGRAVLQTPFSSILTRSFEDPAFDTDELRLRFYGQEDHVRVYGRDLFDRLQSVGFSLAIKQHGDYYSREDAIRYGVNEREDLILVTK